MSETCGSTHCVTCGDVADPMTVLTVDATSELAVCADDAGAESTVEVALVGPVAAGDRLLVHAGTAISMLESGAAFA